MKFTARIFITNDLAAVDDEPITEVPITQFAGSIRPEPFAGDATVTWDRIVDDDGNEWVELAPARRRHDNDVTDQPGSSRPSAD